MRATARSTPAEPLDVSSPTALAYETTEEARLLLADQDLGLAQARIDAGEAAYYLSDTIEPDDRTGLLALAERRSEPLCDEDEIRATQALMLLADAAGEVEQMLRGPTASTELRIALRALRRAIDDLATHSGPTTNHLDANSLAGQRLGLLRRRRTRDGS